MKLNRGIVVAIVFVVLSMAGIAVAQAEEGVANFYNDSFQGKKTSSGEPYDKNGLTAAHKKLANGTKVKVTNVANGKSVVVTITGWARRARPSSTSPGAPPRSSTS